MRPQNGKRGRSRGRNKGNHGNLNRTLESNGPDVKIRGSAAHIHEKYQQLARDAHSSGDRVGAENYLQHAEHYYRLMMAALPPGQTMPYNQGQQGQFNSQGDGQDDGDMDGPETGEALPPQYQPQQHQPQQHANGGGHNQNQPRDQGEYRDQRDQREYRQPRDQGGYRDQREQRDFREPRDQREYREQQQSEQREPRREFRDQQRDQGEQREPRREFREQRDQQPRDQQPSRDQQPRDQQPRDQQARDQQPRDQQLQAREPREPREPRQDRGEGNDRRLNGRSRRIPDDRVNANGRVITTLETADPNAPPAASPVPADDAAGDDTDEALA